MKRPKRKRQFTLDDLQALVERLDARLHIQIVPRELIVPMELDEPKPKRPPKAPKKGTK